jgi:hypothetical protein
MSHLQSGGAERQVPPFGMLLDGLELAEAAEIQREIDLFNGTLLELEPPKPVFGDGVVPNSTAKPQARKYPRTERVANWRSEGRPGERIWRERPDVSFERSWALTDYLLALEDDPLGDDEEPSAEAPFPTKFVGRAGRATLKVRAMYQAYEDKTAEEQAKIRQSIDEIFDAQEATRAAEEISPDEAERLAEAETGEFEAIENPGRAAQSGQTTLDSPFLTPQSLQEYLAFKSRRKAA